MERSMSRTKLDLNSLLAKYENFSPHGSNMVSYPAQQNIEISNQLANSFYNNSQHIYEVKIQPQPFTIISNNFQMSKSQCQQFLYKIRQELRKEQIGIKHCQDNGMKQVQDLFYKQHQTIKREILQLLQRAFQENQKLIKRQLQQQTSIQCPEFLQSHKRIADFDQKVTRLLHSLKSSQYRKAIAQVVLKDFNSEIVSLKAFIKSAKQDYIGNLAGTQIDRSKVECIKKDLQNLFTLSKRNANLVNNVFLNVVDKRSREQQPYQINIVQSNENVRIPYQSQDQKKSFFNFLL